MRHITLAAIVSLPLSLGCASCALDPPPSEVATLDDQPCPLGIAGTTVQLLETSDGIDITFLAESGLDELRARVRHAAAMHGPDTQLGIGHQGEHRRGGERHGLRLWAAPEAAATVFEIEGGAVLRLRTERAEEAPTLQAHVRDRVARMSQIPCG
jgi:hypothetical protein